MQDCSREVRTRKYNTEMVDKNGLLFQKNSISWALEYIKVSQCADAREGTGRRTVLSNSRRRTRSSRRLMSEDSISRGEAERSGSGVVERSWGTGTDKLCNVEAID